MIKWKWTTQETFSTASAYKVLHNRGVGCPFNQVIWKLKVPLKVRVFLWITSQDKLLTQLVLRTRGCNVEAGCHLCPDAGVETTGHILFECAYAMGFWRILLFRHNLRINVAYHETILELWWKSRQAFSDSVLRLWDTVWSAGCWALWRERNRRQIGRAHV